MASKVEEAGGPSVTLSAVLERLQDALYEPVALPAPSTGEDSEEDYSMWNQPTTDAGKAFRLRITEFEADVLTCFATSSVDDGEFTLEQSDAHAQYCAIIESEIEAILADEFSMKPREFFKSLMRHRDQLGFDDGVGSELMAVFFNVLSFQDFCKEMRRKVAASDLLVVVTGTSHVRAHK